MLSYITYVQFANALLCLLLAAQFLFMASPRPWPKRILGLNFLLYAHQSILLISILHGQAGAFSLLRPLGAMWLGPLLYLYFCLVQKPDAILSWRDGLHFVFGALVIILLKNSPFLIGGIDLVIMASFILYFLLIALRMRQGKQSLQHLGTLASPAYRLLICLMLMALINIAAEIAVNQEIQTGVKLQDSVALFVAACTFLLLNIATLLAALQRSNWLEWMYQLGSQPEQKSLTEEEQQRAADIMQRFKQLVIKEQLYKQEFGITLPQAAKKLQLPARQLSTAINQLYGQSYSVYLNDQRINEAKRLLLAEPDMPVIEVMQQAGFSSKSNFNKEFLRVTGLSPSAFRQNNSQGQ
ncbi:AraC family transcriptional regulator [Rheinheimera soli]|uniref:AraC family transcriptional regulator n=1 Tax=Rheinheimera soli TaxID=443616 RepID=UPI001E5EE441|nr:helix-turn-helix domain-containing protein [Rheinheimera soli]